MKFFYNNIKSKALNIVETYWRNINENIKRLRVTPNVVSVNYNGRFCKY